MFDIAPTELMVVAVIALVVIGPKELPAAMRVVGKWVGKVRAMAGQFRSGLDTMMREAEMEELEKKWRAQNEEIMRQFPRAEDAPDSGMAPVITSTAPPPAPPPALTPGEPPKHD